MSGKDVLKSLLRSSARSAASGLRGLPVTAAIERALQDGALGRARISDAQLTAAVARLPGLTAATLSSSQGRINVDIAFNDGEHLAVALRPAGVRFAPGGAKEISFALEPADIVSSKLGEVVAAIACEIARVAYRSVLSRAPRAEWTPQAMRDGERMVFDLRSVPEVRWAQSRRWAQAALELLRIREFEVDEGGLSLKLGIEGLKIG